jgi:acetyl-CoA carboxylase biotin carboxyl carrier protein
MADVLAHITGTVWKIEVQPGKEVAEGDVLIILESMKMEMPVEAPVAGVVSEIKVKEGEAVDEGRVVAVIVEG